MKYVDGTWGTGKTGRRYPHDWSLVGTVWDGPKKMAYQGSTAEKR